MEVVETIQVSGGHAVLFGEAAINDAVEHPIQREGAIGGALCDVCGEMTTWQGFIAQTYRAWWRGPYVTGGLGHVHADEEINALTERADRRCQACGEHKPLGALVDADARIPCCLACDDAIRRLAPDLDGAYVMVLLVRRRWQRHYPHSHPSSGRA